MERDLAKRGFLSTFLCVINADDDKSIPSSHLSCKQANGTLEIISCVHSWSSYQGEPKHYIGCIEEGGPVSRAACFRPGDQLLQVWRHLIFKSLLITLTNS